MNGVKTAFLLTLFTALLVLVGHIIDTQFKMHGFVVIFFGFSVIMNFVSYWYSDKIVLAMYGAKKVDPSQAPELARIVGNLAQKGGIPNPSLYIIPNESPNAFATGRSPNNAAVAVTEGILRILNSDELEAVIAHELSHIKHRDTLIATIIATFAGLIMTIGSIARFSLLFFGGSRDGERDNTLSTLFLAIVAPIAALLIQLAISRAREFKADAGSAKMTRNPAALANALMKLEQYILRVPMQSSPATSHLFISSPSKAKSLLSLFSTHPTTEARVENLRKIGRELGQIF